MLDLLWTLQRIRWVDLVDITLVAAIFFGILYLVRGTRAVSLLRGIILLIILLALLSTVFRLRAFAWLVERALPALLVAIPVIFQPELRRALERLGRAGQLFTRSAGQRAALSRSLSAIAEACRVLSRRRIGALIVLERETGLQEYVETGVMLDAEVSPELLIALFDPHVALHDGAVILRDGRVVAAACVLPLSTAFLEDRRLGLRHRAALGVTEETDAIAIVVSEERGSISVAHNGRIIRDLEPDRLERVLRAFYQNVLEPRRFRKKESKESEESKES
ncbi:MAG: diadenylate cyclase CdaA [Anaerolineae bacterium]|nr:diadenylate cyclase CdaA [Anaerolineae bacterium]